MTGQERHGEVDKMRRGDGLKSPDRGAKRQRDKIYASREAKKTFDVEKTRVRRPRPERRQCDGSGDIVKLVSIDFARAGVNATVCPVLPN